jgi:hypothetical protein
VKKWAKSRLIKKTDNGLSRILFPRAVEFGTEYSRPDERALRQRPFRVNAMPWAASYREKSAGVLAD